MRGVFAGGVLAAAAAVVAFAAGDSAREPTAAERAAAALSPKQLAGQRIVASYAGTEPPRRLVKMARRGQLAGVIFFEPNISDRRQMAGVAARLQRAVRRSSLPEALRAPLLLMVDQEGGLVRRLPGAPRRSQAKIGNSPDPKAAARKAGRGAGQNLARAGLNVNLAPVLDVKRRGGGALADYGRTYGRKPGKVGRIAKAFIAAQQRTGVAATAKHFPGLGAAPVNTDDAAVRIDTARRRLRRTDEAPYADAIEAGVRLVMLANATYTSIDRHRPAGLSPKVIGGELRERIGYEGVTITDALEASGLGAFGPVPKRGLRAARAGADLLLFAGLRVGNASSGWKRVVKAIRSGKLDRGEAVLSASRVLELRSSL